MKENNPIAFASTLMVMMINVFLFIIGGCYVFAAILFGIYFINGSLKFEITAKRLYAASQRVL